jgi:CheY-like chemotaxis protein
MSPDDALGGLAAWLEGPVAIFRADGTAVVRNAPFERWAGAYGSANLDRRREGAWLVAEGREPLPVRAEPLAGGSWMVLPLSDTGRIGADAVATTVMRRLDRVILSMEANLSMALRERPGEGASASMREALADVDELRVLRRHVAGLVGAQPPATPGAVNLPALTREAVLALSGPPPVEFEGPSDARVVLAVREQLFAALAALIGTLCRALPPTGVLRVSHQGDATAACVNFRPDPRFLIPLDRVDIDAARAAAEAAGGRLLVDDQRQVVLQLSTFEAGGGRVCSSGRGLVLIADDDPSVLAMMGAVLRNAGFTVLEADNGVAACSIVRTHGPELRAVVTDAVLPGCSGVEVVGEVRRTMPHVPVLLITGHDEDLVAARGIPVLRKPFGARLFRERVTGLIDAGSG